MKNLDLFSKRVFIAGISISVVLLCASLFLAALRGLSPAEAKSFTVDKKIASNGLFLKDLQAPVRIDQDTTGEEDIHAIYAFGIGIREGNLYFGILYNNNTIGLHKAPADGPDVLDW